ncbi:MAG: hypothetical protein JNJ43_12340 [Anaerolineales bacterium]|nr:hypothetical protein [Anaerolineales bacterium]
MDLSILIAALSLIIAGLSEARSIWRDKSKDEIKSVGVILIQIVFTLDKIIAVGEKLIRIIANIPLTNDKVFGALASTKKEILELIDQQKKNLEVLDELYSVTLNALPLSNKITLGDTIEIMLATKLGEKGGPKGSYLYAVEYVLMNLDGNSQYKYLSNANKIIKTFINSIHINKKWGDLQIEQGKRIRVGVLRPKDKKEIVILEAQETASYDLTRKADIRRLLEISKLQLEEMKLQRNQISDFIQSSFLLKDLMN